MLTKKLLTVAVLLASTALTSPSFAKGGPGGPAEVFLGLPPALAGLDTDGDGTLSRAELKAGQASIQTARAEEFATIDADPNALAPNVPGAPMPKVIQPPSPKDQKLRCRRYQKLRHRRYQELQCRRY